MTFPAHFLKHLQFTKPYTSSYSETSRGMMRMHQNEALVPLPYSIWSECLDSIVAYSHLYPDPNCSLLLEQFAENNQIEPDQVIVTNGSNSGLEILSRALLTGGTQILIDSPTYEVMRMEAEIQQAEIVPVFGQDIFADDVSHILEAIAPDTKVVYIVNPGNPTGKLYNQNNIRRVLESGKMVILDEAYVHFAGGSSLPLIRNHGNLVVLQTLSKAFFGAGLRLGFLISQAQNIEVLRKLITPWTVSLPIQVIGKEVLRRRELSDRYIQEVNQSKRLVCTALAQMGIEVRPCYTNFILAKFDRPAEIAAKLKECGILVSDKSHLPQMEGYIRITLGTQAIAKELIAALKRII